MATYCPTCGTSNPDDAKSCHYCDTSLARFASDGALASGTLINYRYRITKLIKAGGMGAVYLAKDLKKNKIRAVKELFKQFSPQEEQYVVQRFKEEAEILSKLKHPNLPRVTDYFHDYDRYYLVMDYIQGDDLESILEEEGEPGLPELDVVDWAVQICGVLDYLHSQSPPILYRDTKPSNIMIRYEDGTAMLIDFGLARTIHPGSEKGKTAIGTEGYSPPEQYMGNPETRSDVYALGATMHHLLTGEFPAVPFQFSYVRDLNPDVSEPLEMIVMKALEIEIEDRFSTAREMQEALLEVYPEAYERLEYLSTIVVDKDEEGDEGVFPEEAEAVEVIDEIEEEVIDTGIPELEAAFEEPAEKYEAPFLSVETSVKSESEDLFLELIQKLNSRDMVEKQQAVEELGELGDKRSVSFLIEVLEYKNQELTRTVIKALGNLQDASAVPVLVKCLNNSDPITKQLASVALGEIGDLRGVKPLVKILAQGDVGTRATAAYSLGNIGSKEAVFPLLDAFIEDLDADVRQYAAESIAQIEAEKELTSFVEGADEEDAVMRKDLVSMFFPDYTGRTSGLSVKKTVSSLTEDHSSYIEMLKSRDPSVREEGLTLLAGTGDKSAAPIFIDFLGDESEAVAIKSIDFLVELGELTALDAIVNLLSAHKPILRQKAAWALGELGDERSLKPLLELLNHNDGGTRATAAYSLGNLGSKRAMKSLLDMVIEDNDGDARRNAAESIVQIETSKDLSYLVDIAMKDDPEMRRSDVLDCFPSQKTVPLKGVEPFVLDKIGPYLESLNNPSNRIRKDACRALGNMKFPEAIPYLIEALKDSDESVCRAAGYALTNFPQAVKPLMALLAYPNFLTVQMAVWVLGELKASEATLAIMDLLYSKDSNIRESAAHSLGNIGDKRAVEELIRCFLEDNKRDVRCYSAEALGKIAHIREMSGILDVAKSDNKSLRHQTVLQIFPEASNFLPHMPVSSGFTVSEEIHIPEAVELNSPDPGVRASMISLVADKYGDKVLSKIVGFLGDPDDSVRDSAIIALAGIGNTSVLNEITACLEDPSPVICQRATWALGELKDRRALPILLELLGNHDPAVRVCAAYALGNLGDERAVEKLCNSLLNDREPQVRTYAAESLGQIKDKRASSTILNALKREQDEDVRKVIAKVFSELRFMPESS